MDLVKGEKPESAYTAGGLEIVYGDKPEGLCLTLGEEDEAETMTVE